MGLYIDKNVSIFGYRHGSDARERSDFMKGSKISDGFDENESTILCTENVNVCFTFVSDEIEINGLTL